MTLKKKLLGLGTGLLAAIALSGALATAQAQPRYGDGWNCRAQIERAEYRYERAIRRHGRNSYQARERRRELRHVRNRCDHRRYRDHRPY